MKKDTLPLPTDTGALVLPVIGTFVYRHISATGDLLYAGITSDIWRRMGQHAAAAIWWPSVARIEWDVYELRREAEYVEAWLIHEYLPPHNRHGKGGTRIPKPYIPPPERTHEDAIAAARALKIGDRY